MIAQNRARRARARPRCRAARVGRPAGICASRDGLLAELADVIIIAAVAMSGITGVQWTKAAVTRSGA